MKKHNVVKAKLDLPFYLRLPSNRFISNDNIHGHCLIIPFQKLGEKVFNKKTQLLDEKVLLDDPPIHPLTTKSIPGYDYQIRSEVGDKQFTTLETRIREDGGFTQLFAYTEVNIFVYVLNQEPLSQDVKNRLFSNLNHFLKIYRLITQDPFVFKIDSELNLYYVDWGIGKIGVKSENESVIDILELKEVVFRSDIGDQRGVQVQMNVLDDIFPGKILENNFMSIFVDSIQGTYDLPTHYDLILESQKQLKFRSYSTSIIDTQTSVESYVSQLLSSFMRAEGQSSEEIVSFFQENMFNKRLKKLDYYIETYKSKQNEKYIKFVDSELYWEWKNKLYLLRNKIVHEGLRELTFINAQEAIGVGKKVLFHFENLLPEYRNSVQIYQGVEFLHNTAGRIIF